MEFDIFNKKKKLLREDGLEIPEYYFFIDDHTQYTPRIIAEMFGKSQKVVREWFKKGLKKQGRLPSMDPSRHVVSGYELKKWLYKKDIEVLARNSRYQAEF